MSVKYSSFFRMIDSNLDIYVFGAGALGSEIIAVLMDHNRRVSGIFDNDKVRWGEKICGIKISGLEAVRINKENTGVIIACNKHADDIKQQLLGIGIKEKNMIIFSNKAEIIALFKDAVVEDDIFVYDEPYRVKNSFLSDKVEYKRQSEHMKEEWPAYRQDKRHCKYDVAICGIFKDEACYLREWLEYHLIIGVDHFYLYNNFSADEFEEILAPYIDNGIVTLIDWPYKQAQIAAYENCINKFKDETKWIGFIDIDEFIVPKATDDIYLFLRQFDNRGSVLIYWKMYCSSGIVNRENNALVIEDFVLSYKKYSNIGKCFYNTGFEYEIASECNKAMHHFLCTTYRGKRIMPVNCFDNVVFGMSSSRSYMVDNIDFPIQINHYFTKSWSEYMNKRIKTDVYHEINPHTIDYFFEHEIKCDSVDYSAYKYLMLLKKRILCLD